MTKTLALLVISLVSFLAVDCTPTENDELAAHFHGKAKQTAEEEVMVTVKVPGRFGETKIYLAEFESLGRIMEAPQEGVKNPGRQELVIGRFSFTTNPEEELKSFEGEQDDNEVYSWNAECDNMELMIRIDPKQLAEIEFATIEVFPPKGVEIEYGSSEKHRDDDCYEPFAELNGSSPGSVYGFIYLHGGHAPPADLERGEDGIKIER